MLLGHYRALYIITLPLIGKQSIVMHVSICVSLELLLQTSYFYAPHHIEALAMRSGHPPVGPICAPRPARCTVTRPGHQNCGDCGSRHTITCFCMLSSVRCCQQGNVGSKTLHQQNTALLTLLALLTCIQHNNNSHFIAIIQVNLH